MISIVFAVLFLVVLFLLKNTSILEKSMDFIQGKKENGLVYESNITVGELVDKDTDGDGIPDWEEPLYGLDPTKKETIPGIPDSTTIAKMKADQGKSPEPLNGNYENENLTQTDKFSRELFSTIASLSQNGSMDQDAIDKLSTSLAENIKNSAPRKIFVISDLKIIKDNSPKAIKYYLNTLNNIDKKYSVKESDVVEILQQFSIDENNVDTSVLIKLDPIIKKAQDEMFAVRKMNVPESLAYLHLDLMNAGERVTENLIDMKLFETDPLVTLSAISKYDQNVISMGAAVDKLMSIVKQKLNN